MIQRVLEASVRAGDRVTGKIGRGFLVLVGVEDSDTDEVCDRMVRKMTGLRIFEDEEGKTNLSLSQVDGELLIVSQFTLYADCRKGNRPSFVRAGGPEKAERLYRRVIEESRKSVRRVEEGSFGAEMQVSLINDGPFTVILDSRELFGTD